MTEAVPGVGDDSRGIIRPWLMAERASLHRYPPGTQLAGIIDRFWAVTWDVPDGEVFDQQVLTHPCANLTVAPAPPPSERWVAVLNGVSKRLTQRRLIGKGWAVAAMTTPGGLGALITGDAARYTNRLAPLASAIAVPSELASRIEQAGTEEQRVAVLAAALSEVVGQADPARVRAARAVAAVAALAETDRTLVSTAQLAAAAGVGVRTLQRHFQEFVGVSPTWLLRRYRILEAAELARAGTAVAWADVAAQLGYSDQPHLIRDFRAATGTTPASYAATARPELSPPFQR